MKVIGVGWRWEWKGNLPTFEVYHVAPSSPSNLPGWRRGGWPNSPLEYMWGGSAPTFLGWCESSRSWHPFGRRSSATLLKAKQTHIKKIIILIWGSPLKLGYEGIGSQMMRMFGVFYSDRAPGLCYLPTKTPSFWACLWETWMDVLKS